MILALLLLLASGQSYRYWIQPCADPSTGCQITDPELAAWAMQAWENTSGGRLHLEQVKDPERAHIRVYWAGPRQGLYGEARPIVVEGRRGAEVYVLPAGPSGDALLRDTIVYLTCLHETGHALGLAHTAQFDDIMYSFQFGGDIPEYFGRYRRRLKGRADIRKVSGISEQDQKRLIATLP